MIDNYQLYRRYKGISITLAIILVVLMLISISSITPLPLMNRLCQVSDIPAQPHGTQQLTIAFLLSGERDLYNLHLFLIQKRPGKVFGLMDMVEECQH